MGTEVSTRAEVGVQEAEPTSLVRLAIDKGVDVEVLERLVALQERVTEREARQSFVSALTAFREECPPIPRTRENNQFQKVYRDGTKGPAKYAALEDIERIARPIAAHHGLTWTWDTEIGDGMMSVTCRVLHIDGHSESSTVAMPTESKAGSSAQQKFGSAQTYGMRYSLIAALGLTTADDDLDGAGPVGEPITEEQAADLKALAEEVGADLAKFERYLGSRLEELPAARVGEAITALERKRK